MMNFNVSHRNKIGTAANSKIKRRPELIQNELLKSYLSRTELSAMLKLCKLCGSPSWHNFPLVTPRLKADSWNYDRTRISTWNSLKHRSPPFWQCMARFDRTWQNKIMEGLLRRKQFAYSTDYKQLLCKNPVGVLELEWLYRYNGRSRWKEVNVTTNIWLMDVHLLSIYSYCYDIDL